MKKFFQSRRLLLAGAFAAAALGSLPAAAQTPDAVKVGVFPISSSLPIGNRVLDKIILKQRI